MIEKPAKGPVKRDPACLRLEREITLPKGIIFRQAAKERGGKGYVECPIGHGKDFTSYLVVQLHDDAVASGDFKKVIVA